MYRKIVAAIDCEDDEGSELVLRRCAALARHFGGKVSLVHVRLHVPEAYTRHLPAHWEVDEARRTKDMLRDLAREHLPDDHLATLHAPSGSIARRVIEAADELQADVIVVAAHKATLGRMVLGSNANAIMRDAQCDVLIVRQSTGHACD